MNEFLKLFSFWNFTIWKMPILKFEKILNILGVQIISKKWKNEFENKNIKWLMFRYFNIRNFVNSHICSSI